MALPTLNYTPTTPISFFTEQTRPGPPGEGLQTEMFPLTTEFGSEVVDTFWCEWRNDHGVVKATLYNAGVQESATVRMAFIPEIYDALRRITVAIALSSDNIKNPLGYINRNDPNAWQVFGQPDNVGNQGVVMEFQVRRFEAK